jgi:hypothetical protein
LQLTHLGLTGVPRRPREAGDVVVKQSPFAADKDSMLRLALTLSVAAFAAAFAALFGSR